MSVLDRLSKETRRRTGWLLPAAITIALSSAGPQARIVIERGEQLRSAGLAVLGIAVGLIWQWYSPRDLADRLVLPALAVVVFTVLQLLPFGETTRSPGYVLWFPAGVLAGLVLMSSWQRRGEPAD